MRLERHLGQACLAITVGDHGEVALRQFERHGSQAAFGYGASDDEFRNDGGAGTRLDRLANRLVAGQHQEYLQVGKRNPLTPGARSR